MSELISREAALDCFRDWIDRYGNEHTADEDATYQRIAELPAVQPETATVTIARTKGGVTMWYECDTCGEPIDQKDCYCRNCGRKLKYE